MELLLGHGIDVNYSSSEHGTALRHACANRMVRSVQMLLDHGADVNAYEEKHGSVLAAAIGTPKIVELLLRQGGKVLIRERDLLAAALSANSIGGEYYVKLFLEHDQSLRATEPVIIQVIVDLDWDSIRGILPHLLERDGGLGTTPAMLKAAKNPKVMRLLLDHKPICELTAEVLEAVVEESNGDFELIQLLLAHDPKLQITQDVVMAGIRHESIDYLFARNIELEVTNTMLKAAEKPAVMKLLLERRRREQPINSEAVEDAASRCVENEGFAALVPLLLEHDKSIKITPPVFQGAMYNENPGPLIEALLKHDPALEIGPEQLLTVIKSHWYWNRDESKRQIVELLVKHGKTLDFTPEIIETLDETYPSDSDKDMKECFYKLKRRDTL